MAFAATKTLSDIIEKGGAYAGLAAFFGLAVMVVLYFGQARELKRLREWAGRAPERAQELEARMLAQADAARRGPPARAARGPPPPPPGPPPPPPPRPPPRLPRPRRRPPRRQPLQARPRSPPRTRPSPR